MPQMHFLRGVWQKLTASQDDFIQEVNDAINAGNMPPKSKKIDLLQHVAVCLHVFDYTTSELIESRQPRTLPQSIWG